MKSVDVISAVFFVSSLMPYWYSFLYLHQLKSLIDRYKNKGNNKKPIQKNRKKITKRIAFDNIFVYNASILTNNHFNQSALIKEEKQNENLRLRIF